jgi:hypothetical protein
MKKHTLTVVPNSPTTFRFEIKNTDNNSISYCEQTIEEMKKFVSHIRIKLDYMDNYNYLTKYYNKLLINPRYFERNIIYNVKLNKYQLNFINLLPDIQNIICNIEEKDKIDYHNYFRDADRILINYFKEKDIDYFYYKIYSDNKLELINIMNIFVEDYYKPIVVEYENLFI